MEKEQSPKIRNLKPKIVTEIGNLSRLLGMMPNGDATVIEARDSFLKLSVLIGEALDIQW